MRRQRGETWVGGAGGEKARRGWNELITGQKFGPNEYQETMCYIREFLAKVRGVGGGGGLLEFLSARGITGNAEGRGGRRGGEREDTAVGGNS